MDKLVRIISPLGATWGRLNPVQKATATMVCLLAVGGLIAAIALASRPQYTVLFSNLNATDAGAIVEKLKESKTDYRLTAGGTAIEVPSQKVYDLRIQLAGEGLPQGGNIGFEIFDKSTFGMTEFTQRLDYQRALQGELTRTISQMEPVASARVHISIPEESVFSQKEKEASASVFVKLRPGRQLNADQVAAITHLVSAAVEGLKPSNVAVVDTSGNLLSDFGSGPMGTAGLRLSSSQLQMQRDFEAQTARDLQVMLEKVLGPGKAVVRVNARMNFDTKQTDNELYDPQGVLVSEEQQEETYKGAPRGMPGVPAIATSMGGPSGITTTSASGDNYTRTQSSNKYEVSKRVEHITQAPGKVEKLSVAVLIDGTVSPAMNATIRQAVSTAIGFDATRGDQVTVDSLPFDNSAMKAQEKEIQKEASHDLYMNVGKWAVAIILGLGFLFFLRSFLSNWKPIEVTESYPEPIPLREVETLELRSAEPAQPHEPVSDPRQALEIAKANPEEVAKLVRSWLAEGES